ncbi:MAG: InlB B-repeat-containing protein [Defluviitaleaceae bacterium]|nr:InlB B-repeat-containing protein [Defluviitaleaceae bacterium]
MEIKKALKVLVAIIVLLSSFFHFQPVFTHEGLIVSFELNGGTFAPDFASQYIDFEEMATRPARDPVRIGYLFSGWFTAGDLPFDFSLPLFEDTTIYAHWLPAWEVIFDFNGGMGEMVIEHGVTVTFPSHVSTMIARGTSTGEPTTELGIDVHRAGYQLIGWTTVFNDPLTLFDFQTAVTSDLTLYALWEVLETAPLPVEPLPTEPLSTEPVTASPPEIQPTPIQPAPVQPVLPQPTPTGPPAPPIVIEPIPIQPVPPQLIPGPPPMPDTTLTDWDQLMMSSTGQTADAFQTSTESSMIRVGPPASSRIMMAVNEEGHVVITGPQLGDGEIMLVNAPPGLEFLNVGIYDELFILFPSDTVVETVDVILPTEAWSYAFFEDESGELILTLLPPDVALATVLNDPMNPNPYDQTLLAFSEEVEEIDDVEIDQDRPRETETTYIEEENGDETSPSALLAGSLALVGVACLLFGSRMLKKNKD